MTDKKEPLLKEWGWPFARKQRVQKAENNLFPGFEWPSIFDEANEMLLASIMIYALVDLRTLARKGVLSALEEGEDLPNRILTLPVSTREIVRLVSKNRETILDQIGASSTDLYLSAFDSIQDTTARHVVCAETGETILVSSDVVVCDDLNSDTELVYGIWLDSARQRMTVTFRGCTTLTDWTTSTHQYLKSIPNPVTPPEAGSPTDIAIHYGFFGEL